jgi:hypothetical protein
MKTYLCIAISALAVTGCASASLVQSVYEPTKGGIVKYKNSALGGGPSAEKANTIMANFCSPSNFVVTQQQASTETVGYNANSTGRVNGNSFGNSYNGTYSGNTQVTPVNREYVYVQFRCDQSRATASASHASGTSNDFNSCNDSCYQQFADHRDEVNSCYKTCKSNYGQ